MIMNDQQSEKIIKDILNILQYEDDKDQLYKQFVQNITAQAVLDLIKKLPEEQANELKNKSSAISKPEDSATLLHKYFTDEQYTQALESAAKMLFSGFLAQISTNITDAQRENLNTYLANIQSSTA